jgi:hypothetical protein
VVGNVQAELPAFLAHVELVHARRRHHLEAPHELPDDEGEDGQSGSARMIPSAAG